MEKIYLVRRPDLSVELSPLGFLVRRVTLGVRLCRRILHGDFRGRLAIRFARYGSGYPRWIEENNKHGTVLPRITLLFRLFAFRSRLSRIATSHAGVSKHATDCEPRSMRTWDRRRVRTKDTTTEQGRYVSFNVYKLAFRYRIGSQRRRRFTVSKRFVSLWCFFHRRLMKKYITKIETFAKKNRTNRTNRTD